MGRGRGEIGNEIIAASGYSHHYKKILNFASFVYELFIARSPTENL